MIRRTLSRRLERLQESMIPSTERKVWQIVTINSDGTTAPSGFSFEWPSKQQPDHWQGMSRRMKGKAGDGYRIEDPLPGCDENSHKTDR
jgi:hypothetical protein